VKYRLAIFDSDGTLADTLPWMRSIFNELAEALASDESNPTNPNNSAIFTVLPCCAHWLYPFGSYPR